MKQYEVSLMLNGKSFGFLVMANSTNDAIAIAKATYGPDVRVYGSRIVG